MLRIKGFLLRSVADSNRRTWFCRPVPSHSANRPLSDCKNRKIFLNTQKNLSIIYYRLSVTLTLSILPPMGGFIFETLTVAFFMVWK